MYRRWKEGVYERKVGKGCAGERKEGQRREKKVWKTEGRGVVETRKGCSREKEGV